MLGAGRVCKWSEDIEYCSEAQLPADRTNIFHGSMILLSKEEAEANVFKKLSALFGLKIDVSAKSFETVGSSRK